MKFNHSINVFFVAAALLSGCNTRNITDENPANEDYILGAYIWDAYPDSLPIEVTDLTHLFIAFAQVNDTHDGIAIGNSDFIKRCVALKDSFPELKVLLSLGGAEAYGFSEMAADSLKRETFARDCKRVIDEYDLDGIDMDREVPGNWFGLLCLDQYNNVKLLSDIRSEIGNDKLLTIASPSNLSGIIVDKVLPLIDFINIMSYDMGAAPRHHTAMYRSDKAGNATVEETVNFYLDHGVPKDKMVLGLAFYGRSDNVSFPGWTDFGEIRLKDGMKEQWDSIACVPYIVNADGNMVLSFDNPRSLQIKCDYIREKGLRGGMFWRYGCDDRQGTLRHTVAEALCRRK